MIRRARESIIFQPVREGFSSEYAFRARFSHFSVSLTSPSGRKYITNVVTLGTSSVGAGIRGVTKKGNTYLYPCYNSPCTYRPPNDPLGGQSNWWRSSSCLWSTGACCYDGLKYGGIPWYWEWTIEVY